MEVTAEDLRRFDQESVCSISKSNRSRSTSEYSDLYPDPASQVPSRFLSTPTPPPQLYSPQLLLPEPVVDCDWSLFASTGPQESYCVIVDPAEDMSILGFHYDSQFEAGTRPLSCPWSGKNDLFDPITSRLTRPAFGVGNMDDQYQNQHLGPMRNNGESNDAARRNLKNRMRREISENASSAPLLVSTPEQLPGSLLSYTSSIPPLSLAAEVSPNVVPQGYIAPYQATYSPAMHLNSGHQMFNSDFSMIPNSYLIENYHLHYDTSGNDSSQSVYP